MPLLVVPVDPERADEITLAEWDALLGREIVYFEDAGHPLAARLRANDRNVAAFDGADVGIEEDTAAVVTGTRSPALFELARGGAIVTSGSSSSPDALSAAYGAYVVRDAAASLGALALVMARLRGADGCPWDREQTHESLQVHLVEETYEVIDAIERGAVAEDLEEELGDVLLQVAFHAQLAADDNRFDLSGVADRIVAKLLRRHPHVFGETVVADSNEVVKNWESIKRAEKNRSGPFDDVPQALPALLLAYKTQKRAAGIGFEADAARARANISALVEGDEVGDLLFWGVALARAAGVDPEQALRSATARFRESVEPEAG